MNFIAVVRMSATVVLVSRVKDVSILTLCFPNIHFNIVLPIIHNFPSALVPSGFLITTLHAFTVSPTRDSTCPDHTIVVDIMALRVSFLYNK